MQQLGLLPTATPTVSGKMAAEALAKMQANDPIMNGMIIKTKFGDAAWRSQSLPNSIRVARLEFRTEF